MKDTSVLKWIYRSCGKRNKEGVALVLLNAWSAICVTLFAMLSKIVMDSAQKGEKEVLLKNVILLLVLILSQMLARVLSSLTEAISQGKAEINLKSAIFSNIVFGEYAESVERHSGDLMSRLTADVQMVSENYVHILPTTVSYIVRILTATIALYSLDRRFALIVVVCGVLFLVVAGISRKQLKTLHRRVQEKDAKVRSFMQEMLENLFAVKVFGIEEKIVKISLKQQKKFYREKVKRKSFSILAGIAFSLAFAAGFLVAVAYGSYGILNGTMTFGTVVAIIQLVNQLQTPAVGITSVIPSFFGMVSSAQRLIEITGSKKGNVDYADIDYKDFVRICVENAVFGYNDEKVIEDATFTVNKGEFIGIKGPSGSGKSTIFKLITGLYPLDGGKVVIETTDGELDCKYAKKLFSFAPQGNMLFSGTIRENITILRPDATEEEIRKALKDAAAEFAYDLEDGLDFMLGESGTGISQGQAQRLAIARALLGNGKILLMDEATSALDSETEEKIINNLKNNDEITVLFITHREMVLEQCDRTVTAANGHIWES